MCYEDRLWVSLWDLMVVYSGSYFVMLVMDEAKW